MFHHFVRNQKCSIARLYIGATVLGLVVHYRTRQRYKAEERYPSVLLSSGGYLPRLAFGTGSVWYYGPERNLQTPDINLELVKTVKSALGEGFRHLDCAENYGTEPEIGQAISEFIQESGTPRGELFITTKIMRNIQTPEEAIRGSLSRLKLDYVDLYLIHSPYNCTDLSTTWANMEELVEKGYVKAIGVSNFNREHLEEILKNCKIKPTMNQIEFHPFMQRDSLVQFCHENNILVSAYGSLAPIAHKKDGALTETFLTSLAKKYKQPVANILLYWASKKVDVIVTTSVSKERIRQYLQLFTFKMTDDDIRKIDDLGSQTKFQKCYPNEYDF